jgi:hypothetical protein
MSNGNFTFTCQICEAAISRAQAEFVTEETFAFLPSLPNNLGEGAYCWPCFESHVREELNKYSDLLERAKDVNVFFSTQGKESRFIRRTEKPLHVKDCLDREETVLRLAFLAVLADKNTLVDVELSSTKVQNGKWKSSLWSGRGIPATVSEAALKRKYVGAPN